jgi:hypothetical protein
MSNGVVLLDRSCSTRLRRAIDGTVSRFLENPFDYLYESDLRSTLHRLASEEFHDDRIPLTVHDPKRWHAGTSTIHRVMSEYPSGLRFDLALLSETLDGTKNVWNQPVRGAIELKLWQPDGTGNDFRGDIVKIESYRARCAATGQPFSGLVLLFVHPGAEWRIDDIQLSAGDADIPEDGCAAYLVSRCKQGRIS